MSGNGTAVGAAVAVGEGEGVGEGDAPCACATDGEHSNSRPTTADATRAASLIMLSTEPEEWLGGSSGNDLSRAAGDPAMK